MKKTKHIDYKNFLILVALFTFLIVVSGCARTTINTPSVQDTTLAKDITNSPSIPVAQIPLEIKESCTMTPSTFECPTYTVIRSKIAINFTNNLETKVTVLDFRLKSDNADIYCSGPETRTTVVNALPRGSFVLTCDGIPTGRLPYEEIEEIYFELDYKTSLDNTLRTATGKLVTKVK
ncbi:MAG: hypothetical protein ACP5N2_07780 [Candidatus Nanoarchaeia archaeon]